MAGTPTTPPRKRISAEERKEQLLEAALRRFAEKGYDGATTRDIAEAAGVAEGLLFRYFGSKREVLRAVLQERGPRGELRRLGPQLAELPVREALVLIYGRIVESLWEHRDFVRLVLNEAQRPGEAAEEFRVIMEEGPRFMAEFLRERTARGELRAFDPAVGAATLGGAIFCFFLRQQAEEPEIGRERCLRFVGDCVDLVLAGARPDAAEPRP